MKQVPLLGRKGAGRFALVDDADFELVSRYKWYLLESQRNGHPHGPYAYARPYANGRQTSVYMHKLLTGYARTDHRDHNGLNNQRYNLREATSSQNAGNMRPRLHSGTSRFKGVSQASGGKWSAAIVVNGKRIGLGTFSLEEAAASAYDIAARQHHGEYACPNFQTAGDPLGLLIPPVPDAVLIKIAFNLPRGGDLVKLRIRGRVEHLRLRGNARRRVTSEGPELTLYGYRTGADGVQIRPRPVIRYLPCAAVTTIKQKGDLAS